MLKQLFIILVMMLVSACTSFYEVNHDYNQQFEEGHLEDALSSLRANSQYNKTNVKFLYYVNNGSLLSIMGKYEESNEYFEKAFLFGEDYRINYAREAASYLTNPMVTIYRGEDHEHLMVLYFKALNFLKMEMYEEALVECRRLNIRLQQLADRYTSEKKYKRDAFIHTLMGIIYQADRDWNNAFIAYKSALEIYEDDFGRLFNLQAPDQLKKDLLTAAWLTGFKEEFDFYKSQFGWDDFTVTQPDGELVFFWHNGLSPIKDEWSINFAVNREADDLFIFNNNDLGMRYPFTVSDKNEKSELTDLEFFRVAFPRYVERPRYYTSAWVSSGDIEYPLQLTEDVNKVAFKCLQERMALEFSKSLLRVALKKAVEHSARKEDKALGAVIGAINAATEKADTRNWQTLPHSIHYARIPMKEGTNTTSFAMQAPGEPKDEHAFTYQVKKGQTLFHTFSSLEALPASRY